ncbi:hypothetical protein [Streptomyces sp. NPDC001717]
MFDRFNPEGGLTDQVAQLLSDPKRRVDEQEASLLVTDKTGYGGHDRVGCQGDRPAGPESPQP